MKEKLIEKSQKASWKSCKYETEGKKFLAAYWRRKAKKYEHMRQELIILVKKQLLIHGIERLNTIKI